MAPRFTYHTQYGEVICRDGYLWELTHSEMGPPDSRQNTGQKCPECVVAKTMSRIEEYRNLLKKLEETKVGSDELDHEMLAAFNKTPTYDSDGNFGPYKILPPSQRPTRLLDAALLFVPDGWERSLYISRLGFTKCQLMRWNDIPPFKHASVGTMELSTAPLAVSHAAIRVLILELAP